jgi:MHS family shikimate/dehydroshikimate transporter-like MFS transporter
MNEMSPLTARPAAEPLSGRTMRRVVVASLIGNALEFYDFFLYGTAAVLVFGQLFFIKGTDPLLATTIAFVGFFVGIAVRPIGGIFFGHIGDRYGRKTALVWTLGLMGAATFLIGCLPTYEQVGIWAPLALLLIRIVQGLASGGEWGGGVLMLSESAPPNRRGFYASWSQVGVGGGFVLSAAAFLVVQALPHQQFITWGWRLPFLASILVLGVGVYIRLRLPESSAFVNAERTGRTVHLPVGEVLKHQPKQILRAMGLRFAENGGSFIFLAFSLAYGKFAGLANDVLLTGVMLSMVVEVCAIPLWGRLSDKLGRKPVYFIGSIGLMVVAFPFFWLIDSHVPTLIFLAFLLGNPLCHGAMIGSQGAMMSELFTTEVRYTGMAIGHEVASIFSGGLAPLIATALLTKYHAAWPISLLLIAFGLITVISLLCTPETAGPRVREGALPDIEPAIQGQGHL